ncbi:DNA adenine methylase [Eubacterium callanderi]|uniref:DNA adenine methylase n=1 Tax=Eubacterium callanderi TaxID=53442 RepID=UPI003AB39ADF
MLTIPFSGNKKTRYKEVADIVKRGGYNAVYEPFAGSAVLSVNLYNNKIIEKAVINDYDGLFDIYPEYLDIKEKLVADCLAAGLVKQKELQPPDKREVLQGLVSKIDEKFWHLLANNFVFSGRRSTEIRLQDFRYFMNETGTEEQRAYLKVIDNLVRCSMDYKPFLKMYGRDYLNEKGLMIVDPPYINAHQKSYSNEQYFGLGQTLQLMKALKAQQRDFIIFNMNRCDITELLNLFGFNIQEVRSRYASQCAYSVRDDCMVYVKV